MIEFVCVCTHVCTHILVFYILLSALVQLVTAFCVHLMFLTDKIMHKQMQNMCYAQIVP